VQAYFTQDDEKKEWRRKTQDKKKTNKKNVLCVKSRIDCFKFRDGELKSGDYSLEVNNGLVPILCFSVNLTYFLNFFFKPPKNLQSRSKIPLRSCLDLFKLVTQIF